MYVVLGAEVQIREIRESSAQEEHSTRESPRIIYLSYHFKICIENEQS